MIDTFGNTKISNLSLALNRRLRAKEISLSEFLRECAYWALREGFDELTPLSFPSEPKSEAFIEYNNLLPEKQAKVDLEFFRKNEEILSYFQQIAFIRQKNKAIMGWLKEIKGYLPPDDEVMFRRIDDRLFEFQAFFDDNPLMIEKIKNTFEAREITPKKSYYKIGEVI
jgi:hypothetical protein